MTCDILFPRSVMNSAASVFHRPLASMAIGTKWSVKVGQCILLFVHCCSIATTPVFSAVSQIWD